MKSWRCYAALLPEEEAIADPEDDGDVDPTVPGDLWFFCGRRLPHGESRMMARGRVVYSPVDARPDNEARATA